MAKDGPSVERVIAHAFTIPTATPESDGTIAWDSTTLVVAELRAADARGIGYSYAHASAAQLIAAPLAEAVLGLDAVTALPHAWTRMQQAVRNIGRPGVAAAAISAVDNALWDLKARLLGVSITRLLGAARSRISVYGSGGFTSYTIAELQRQLGDWVADGIDCVKMKVGRTPDDDTKRVRAAREAIGDGINLFVDANGAYDRKQALSFALAFAESGASWFEEPVSSDDLDGLRLLRDRAPAPIEIAAGEYGYDTTYFRRMLEAGAVDVLQADATRCCGTSGFLRAAALCEAFHVPLSSHCAPTLHVPLCCAAPAARHLEWFFDHVRIESMLFDGAAQLQQGVLAPDPERPGFGFDLKRADAERYRSLGPFEARRS